MSRSVKKRGALIGTAVGAIAIALVLLVPTIGSARSQSAPINTAEPEISGSAVQGQTLTATTGVWSNSPASYAFQWLRCPQSGGQGDGSDCTAIAGSTTNTYAPTVADVGFTIRVRVTATNGDGGASAASNATSIVQAASAKPVNTAQPTISGSPIQGQLLTASTGTWSNNPTSFTFQWLRCPQNGGQGDGSDCALIAGATANSFTPAAAAVGSTIRVRVTATNTAGSASAASNATSIVQASAGGPKNTLPPAITGSPVVGQTLTASQGTWTGTTPISYAYQWLRCDQIGGGCAPITGAVGPTWKLTSASVGHTIRVRVTATNKAGAIPATSVPTALITVTPAAPATGCPAGSGPINVNNLKSPARLLIDAQQANPSVVSGGTQQLIVRYHVSACGGRSVQGALVYATALPYNQFSVPPERATDQTGFALLDFQVRSAFPLSPKQGLLTIFARARKSGEDLLGGISTRRLFSIHVSQ